MSGGHGILVVDDELSVRQSLKRWFGQEGFRVGIAADAKEALELLTRAAWDIVLLDIRMPGMDGLDLLSRIRDMDSSIIVIMITGYAAVDTAVEALKKGAFDYVAKPFDPEELSHLVGRALQHRELTTENLRLREKVDQLAGHDRILARSTVMTNVMDLVDTVAKTDSTVLIRGESGTGKELVARAIHSRSARRYFPLLPINCGALTESLLESELFGHERGAFTGARSERKGKLEVADGGTLFLDEIGTISLKTQMDLLRVLETKEFCRLGSDTPKKIDFRVICATNQDLEQGVKDSSFREDFYYRVNVFGIYLPPLRERGDDILLLAEHFVDKYATAMAREPHRISSEATRALLAHRWPGNVRELSNAIERAMVVARDNVILPCDLPFDSRDGRDRPAADSLSEVERRHIALMLERNHWNIKRTAEILQIDRATLYNKIKKDGFKRNG